MPSTICQSAYKYGERSGCVPVTRARDGKHKTLAAARANAPRGHGTSKIGKIAFREFRDDWLRCEAARIRRAYWSVSDYHRVVLR